MSGETSGSIYRDVFISVLVGSVLSFVLQQLNSSGLPIPSSVNVFKYVYPMHPLTPEEIGVAIPSSVNVFKYVYPMHPLTPEEIGVAVGLLIIFIPIIKLIKRYIMDEDWD